MAENPQKPESNNTARSWGQRAELVALGTVGTAAGVGLVEVARRVLAGKAVDEGVRQAAAFGRVMKSVFSR